MSGNQRGGSSKWGFEEDGNNDSDQKRIDRAGETVRGVIFTNSMQQGDCDGVRMR